ncbi:MAG: CHAD domain-containing protein [Acidimicrobiales bacterium]
MTRADQGVLGQISEREAKLEAWPGFVVPDMSGVVDGLTAAAAEPQVLEAVYYDTADLRLARWGATVRYRSGDGTGWTLKLPKGRRKAALVRQEITFEGKPSTVPAGLVAIVKGYTRSSPLAAVAKLRTRRRRVELLEADGRRVAEVVDDEVSVYEGRRLSNRFREIEVELDEGETGIDVLGTVVAALETAGAAATEPVPKLVRALGARAQQPPDVVPAQLGKDASLGDVVRRAVAAATVGLVRHHAGVLLDGDPEDVHQARVATRRLRSDLHTFGALVDAEWMGHTRAELRWLGGLLGSVRDADVLDARLRRQVESLPADDMAGAQRFFDRLAAERATAKTALAAVMSGARYVALLDALVAASTSPPLLPQAAEPAKDHVAGLARGPWRKLSTAASRVGDDAPDQELHDLRIRAKRCRYAVEAVEVVVGRSARQMADAVADLQTVLGDHQDAVVAEMWLRRAVALDAVQNEEPPSMAAGELVWMQRTEAAAGRRDWRAAWDRARRKRLRAWMS